MNSPETGYYSLAQYCPDRSRMETANMGVLLFVPGQKFLRVHLAASNDRIRRFFREEVGDLKQLKLMKQMLEHRIEDEARVIQTPAELERVLGKFANEIIFTPLRAVRVENAEVDLMHLFKELTGGGRVHRDPSLESPMAEVLRMRLETAEFAQKVRRKLRVTVPIWDEEMEADYAFQNGRLNLIQAKEFSQQRTADVLREAAKIAVEGHLLFRHPDPLEGERQLVIVGGFGPAAREEQDKIQGMLKEHEVTLYSSETLDDLIQRIRETAH